MRFSSLISTLLVLIAASVSNTTDGHAYVSCDVHQISKKPVSRDAISVDLVIPFGYLCHHFESNGKDVVIQKAAYTSNGTVGGPLVKGICNWKIDFVYYDTKGKEYMRDKGETVKGCAQGASRALAKGKTLPEFGSSCVELFTDGEVRVAQCRAVRE